MEKSTMELENELTRAKNTQELKALNDENKQELSPNPINYLFVTAKAHGVEESELNKQSQLERTHLAHILNGNRRISREVCLALALAGKFTLDEANTLLKYAGHNQLYARDFRDRVLIFAFSNGLSVLDTNNQLDELGLDIIPKPKKKPHDEKS